VEALRLLVRKRRTPGVILVRFKEAGLPEEGLQEHLATTLVAREGGEVVGDAALELYGGAALLRSVAVRRELRGEGLGQRLVAAALQLTVARGAKSVYLLTEGAEDFFARLGFRRVSRAEVEQASPQVSRSVEFVSACPKSAQAIVQSPAGSSAASPAGDILRPPDG
jgi:amino-acid N-acetyltransferase